MHTPRHLRRKNEGRLLVLMGQRVHEVVVVPIINVTLVGRADGEVSVGNTGNIPTSSSSRCLSS